MGEELLTTQEENVHQQHDIEQMAKKAEDMDRKLKLGKEESRAVLVKIRKEHEVVLLGLKETIS